MTIVRPSAPKQAAAVLGPALEHLLRPAGPQPSAARRVGPRRIPSATQPLRLFRLRLQDIKNAAFTRKAKPVGWRYLIVDRAPVAVADVAQKASAGALSFNSLIHGPLAQDLARACNLAEKHLSRVRGRYEVRVLDIPALSVVALWLHGADSDAFIPLLDASGRVRIDPRFAEKVEEAARRHREALPSNEARGSERPKRGTRARPNRVR
jgi:hypothetical protein